MPGLAASPQLFLSWSVEGFAPWRVPIISKHHEIWLENWYSNDRNAGTIPGSQEICISSIALALTIISLGPDQLGSQLFVSSQLGGFLQSQYPIFFASMQLQVHSNVAWIPWREQSSAKSRHGIPLEKFVIIVQYWKEVGRKLRWVYGNWNCEIDMCVNGKMWKTC